MSLTRSSLRSPPPLGCHSEQVSAREEACGVDVAACATVCPRRCPSPRSTPRCLEGKWCPWLSRRGRGERSDGRIRGPRWETGPWWRSGATQSDQSKTRSGVQTGPWTETYRWQVKMQNMHRFAWCVFVHCMCVSADLFTLRLSVAFCASMRFMASAWLSSAHNCWPMATSSSYSLSPALHALLRLRTCREKKG